MKRPVVCALVALAALGAAACYSPAQSQRYFTEAAKADPALTPLHETPLYTVYYDHVLRRCVLHSSHSWGENGGGRRRDRDRGVGVPVRPRAHPGEGGRGAGGDPGREAADPPAAAAAAAETGRGAGERRSLR